MGGWGGGPCDFSVSPSPFGLDSGTLDFGTLDLGLTITSTSNILVSCSDIKLEMSGEGFKQIHIKIILIFMIL